MERVVLRSVAPTQCWQRRDTLPVDVGCGRRDPRRPHRNGVELWADGSLRPVDARMPLSSGRARWTIERCCSSVGVRRRRW